MRIARFAKKNEFPARPRRVRVTEFLKNTMATPNYAFEKRRRELDKKAKKEEKRKQKLEATNHPTPEAADTPPEAAVEATDEPSA